MKTYKRAQPFCPREVIELIVALAQNGRLLTAHADKETLYAELKDYVGLEFVHCGVVKLAATLGLLCRDLVDGRNKRAAFAYLNYRVGEVATIMGVLRHDLLAIVTRVVQADLDGYAVVTLPRL